MTNMSQEEIDRLMGAAMEGIGTEQSQEAAEEPKSAEPDREPEEMSVAADAPTDALNREGEAEAMETRGPHGEETPVPETTQKESQQTGAQGMGEIRSMKTRDQKAVQNVRYQSFDKKKEPRLNAGVHENIGMIIDMPLQVTVELGKVRMSIKEILGFTLGSIVELDRMAEDLVDVKVNGKLIARGEIVVVDENYGVRITDIVSPERRIKSY